MFVVLAGGVGAARFLKGLAHVVPHDRIVTIVNTADDTELHGLSISPDIDTVTYTLADAIDPVRGWGLRDETWRAMESLARFDLVRPRASQAGANWFNLGDQDLATHFYRTTRLREGASLAQVTDEVRRAFGLGITIVPMSNDPVRTIVHLTEGPVPFQEYFVKMRHDVAVQSVEFVGADSARFIDTAMLHDADTIVIAPSNPIVSIGPMRALSGVDETLATVREKVVAISPIVAGAALKGPADRMLTELGHEASVVGVARMYADICGTMVIDALDADRRDEIEALGMTCVVTDTVMSRPGVAAELARAAIESVRSRRGG